MRCARRLAPGAAGRSTIAASSALWHRWTLQRKTACPSAPGDCPQGTATRYCAHASSYANHVEPRRDMQGRPDKLGHHATATRGRGSTHNRACAEESSQDHDSVRGAPPGPDAHVRGAAARAFDRTRAVTSAGPTLATSAADPQKRRSRRALLRANSRDPGRARDGACTGAHFAQFRSCREWRGWTGRTVVAYCHTASATPLRSGSVVREAAPAGPAVSPRWRAQQRGAAGRGCSVVSEAKRRCRTSVRDRFSAVVLGKRAPRRGALNRHLYMAPADS